MEELTDTGKDGGDGRVSYRPSALAGEVPLVSGGMKDEQ